VFAKWLVSICIAAAPLVQAQTTVIPVWPDKKPGPDKESTTTLTTPEGEEVRPVWNVTRPTLTLFRADPAKANGTAIIVCPGGGFEYLAVDNEGYGVARELQSIGITAFVLKYRIAPSTPRTGSVTAQPVLSPEERAKRPAAMAEAQKAAVLDAQEAVRIVRRRAAEWGIAPDRVGMIGFSPGGMVTMGAVLAADSGGRPNFAAPVYGSPRGAVIAPANAPPLFILCASDDPLVPAAGSLALYSAWREAKASVELHIYSKGSHGFSGRKQGLPVDTWSERFKEWLGEEGFLKKP
jgi:acetyl esterase/lipase